MAEYNSRSKNYDTIKDDDDFYNSVMSNKANNQTRTFRPRVGQISKYIAHTTKTVKDAVPQEVKDAVPQTYNNKYVHQAEQSQSQPQPPKKRMSYADFEEYINEIPDVKYSPASPRKLDMSVVDMLINKVLELYEMIDEADNDDYANHLSRGSLDNSGLSLIRRIYYISNSDNIHKAFGTAHQQKPIKYPYLNIPDKVTKYISSVIVHGYHLPEQERIDLLSHLVIDLIDNLGKLHITMNRSKPFDGKFTAGTGNLIHPDTLTKNVLNMFERYPEGVKYVW